MIRWNRVQGYLVTLTAVVWAAALGLGLGGLGLGLSLGCGPHSTGDGDDGGGVEDGGDATAPDAGCPSGVLCGPSQMCCGEDEECDTFDCDSHNHPHCPMFGSPRVYESAESVGSAIVFACGCRKDFPPSR